MTHVKGLSVSLLIVMLLALGASPGDAAPEGQMTWAVHTTLVPTWFDPAETIQGTPFMVLSATHDALVKPMPVGRGTPRFCEAGRHALAGHRLHEGVMSGREDHERCALDGLRGVEPAGHQRRVHGPRHLPLGGCVAR